MTFSPGTTTIFDYMTVVLTHECNRRCNFCVDSYRGEGLYLTRTNLEAALIFAKDQGIRDILFVGGEPTLHPEIVTFAQEVKRQGFGLVVTSNSQNLDVLYALDAHVDSFNLSYYGQRELPDPGKFKHADLTLSTLIFQRGFLSSREKLDNFIDKYGEIYQLKFSTLAKCNDYATKYNQVEYLDQLPVERKVAVMDEIEGWYYRGHLIKRFDKRIHDDHVQSYKCHVNGHINNSWNRAEAFRDIHELTTLQEVLSYQPNCE